MQLRELCILVKERHDSGECYQILADEYHVSKPVIGRLIKGKKPGKRVSAILHLDPSPDLSYTRARRARLDAKAQEWGYAGWCQFETVILSSKGDIT